MARERLQEREKYANDPIFRTSHLKHRREKRQIENYGQILTTPEDIITLAKDRFKHARALGFRSGLEVKVAAELKAAGVEAEYEAYTIAYMIPERGAKYTPDFILPNGLIIETKGRFTTEDRKKHRLIREQHPHLDIRFVFSNPNAVIGKKSETTYALWCSRLDIPFASRSIPELWLREPPNKARINALFGIGWAPPKTRS